MTAVTCFGFCLSKEFNDLYYLRYGPLTLNHRFVEKGYLYGPVFGIVISDSNVREEDAKNFMLKKSRSWISHRYKKISRKLEGRSSLRSLKKLLDKRFLRLRGAKPQDPFMCIRNRIRYVAFRDPIFLLAILAKQHGVKLNFINVITSIDGGINNFVSRECARFNPQTLLIELVSNEGESDYSKFDRDEDESEEMETKAVVFAKQLLFQPINVQENAISEFEAKPVVFAKQLLFRPANPGRCCAPLINVPADTKL